MTRRASLNVTYSICGTIVVNVFYGYREAKPISDSYIDRCTTSKLNSL